MKETLRLVGLFVLAIFLMPFVIGISIVWCKWVFTVFGIIP